jgi:hypothetical protein
MTAVTKRKWVLADFVEKIQKAPELFRFLILHAMQPASRMPKTGRCRFRAVTVLRKTAVVLIAVLVPALLLAADTLPVGRFSAAPAGGALPEEWEPLTFRNIPKKTHYTLVESEMGTVVRAESRQSASGLIRKIQIDLPDWPVLSWQWRISGVYEKGTVASKDGDDYPARVYVAFRYDPDRAGFLQRVRYEAAKALYGEYPPGNAINYIWANRAEKGTAVVNSHSDRAMMIAVQSGEELAGQWVSETRNVLEDYRRLYGEDPPPVSGVAIMTDSDNTGESAAAWYGDIVFRKQ